MSSGERGGLFRRREVAEWAGYEAGWRVRVLRLVAEDKIRDRRRRRVSAVSNAPG